MYKDINNYYYSYKIKQFIARETNYSQGYLHLQLLIFNSLSLNRGLLVIFISVI